MQGAIIFALAFLVLVGGALIIGVRGVAKEQARRQQNPFSMRAGMRGVAGTALSTSSLFLLVVAVMLNSPPLFYMSTAVVATILAARLQAAWAVRGLRFERFAPEKASVGETVTVELIVWSDQRIRRPLITIVDKLPSKMAATERTASLPIAPAFDMPIRTQYKFRPMRRGRHRWSQLEVFGTDALGLMTMARSYSIEESEILIVPTPLPLEVDLPQASGWGIAETESGQGRGSGIEPRGVREYGQGDSIRYIHWASSARTGRLMVKEFETGHHSAVGFLIQQTRGSDVGEGRHTTLEQMCSHVAYLAERMLRQGAQIYLPNLEENPKPSASPHERLQETLISLAGADANRGENLGAELLRALNTMPSGSILYLLVSSQDKVLPAALRQAIGLGHRVMVLVYEANDFLPKRTRLALPAASEPGFVEDLRRSGATVVEVPRGGAK